MRSSKQTVIEKKEIGGRVEEKGEEECILACTVPLRIQSQNHELGCSKPHI